jgi:hypothetical protein
MSKRHSHPTAQPAEINNLINIPNSNPFTNQTFITGSNQAAEQPSRQPHWNPGKPREASQQTSTHRENLSDDTFNSMTAEFLNQTSFDNLSNINIQPHDISILISPTITTATGKLREATQQASI